MNPHLEYKTISYEKNGQKYVSIIAAERIEAVVAAGRLKEGQYSVSEKSVRGSELEGLRYNHPFVEKNPTDKDAYMVILADYVTTEDGTGLVHIAPGHGLMIIFQDKNMTWQFIRQLWTMAGMMILCRAGSKV